MVRLTAPAGGGEDDPRVLLARIEDASETVSAIIAAGIIPAALEMLDEVVIRAIEEGIRRRLSRRARAPCS